MIPLIFLGLFLFCMLVYEGGSIVVFITVFSLLMCLAEYLLISAGLHSFWLCFLVAAGFVAIALGALRMFYDFPEW